MVYIIKIDPPLCHAKYYVGWCKEGEVIRRWSDHECGRGAKICRAAIAAGHRLELVAYLPNASRHDERAIKNRKNTPKFVNNLPAGWVRYG